MGSCCQGQHFSEQSVLLDTSHQSIPTIQSKQQKSKNSLKSIDQESSEKKNSQKLLDMSPHQFHIEGNSLEVKEVTGDQDELNDSQISLNPCFNNNNGFDMIRGRTLNDKQSQYGDAESRVSKKSILKKPKGSYNRSPSDTPVEMHNSKKVHFSLKKSKF